MRVEPCRRAIEVTDVAEFWRGMVDGNAMLQWVKGRTDPALWFEREQMSLAWLRDHLAVPSQVDSLAWLGFGRKGGGLRHGDDSQPPETTASGSL